MPARTKPAALTRPATGAREMQKSSIEAANLPPLSRSPPLNPHVQLTLLIKPKVARLPFLAQICQLDAEGSQKLRDQPMDITERDL